MCAFGTAGASRGDGQRTGCGAGKGASAESERQGSEDCRRDLGM